MRRDKFGYIRLITNYTVSCLDGFGKDLNPLTLSQLYLQPCCILQWWRRESRNAHPARTLHLASRGVWSRAGSEGRQTWPYMWLVASAPSPGPINKSFSMSLSVLRSMKLCRERGLHGLTKLLWVSGHVGNEITDDWKGRVPQKAWVGPELQTESPNSMWMQRYRKMSTRRRKLCEGSTHSQSQAHVQNELLD